ncbi:MAG TPA: peptidoglycan-associated lipoprotein Pal [Deltaproteobacteria bacterium]|nr:peptidoglycan-associated lipoprotein Pal [Deltaproteobacteria bacterium]
MSRALILSLLTTVSLTSACKKEAPPVNPTPEPAPATPAAPAAPEAVRQLISNFQRVHFETDSSTLSDESKRALDTNAKILQGNTEVRVQIQGHADERGTSDYNLQLGNGRADSVKKYLVSMGVAGSRLEVISYGEELPAKQGHNEAAWSANRRAEFVVTWGQGVEGTTPR